MQAIWLSASGDLAMDAERDFRDIGALQYDPVRIHNLRKLKIPKGGRIADLPGRPACFNWNSDKALIVYITTIGLPK